MLNKRSFAVNTPLGPDVLLLKSLQAHDSLSGTFRLTAELLCEERWIDSTKLMGQPLTIEMELETGHRTFSGIVTHFGESGAIGRYARYVAIIEPWLSLLDLTADCRVFQQQTVPDVLKQVFRDFGFSDFEERLYEAYKPREYVVQYRETALAFVSRLMEEEGIYYYFRHEGTQHYLVLADSMSAHERSRGYEEVPFFPPNTHGRRERDHLSTFDRFRQIQSGRLALTDYDFTRPKASLLAQAAEPNDHAHADFEIFDYPGGHLQTSAGEANARHRLEGLNAGYERFEASGNSRGLAPGTLFKLMGHPEHDGDYLIVTSTFSASVSGYETGSDLEENFDVRVSAIDAKRTFRPRARATKPVVHGLQNALVVGPAGEEIWTDKYGRVKVHFPWDRHGTKDENSSCWVRVAQTWAGSHWGHIQLPRVGHEVLVEFLEGDPDRPVVMGRVYNADNMPPYTLPDHKTQSGIKSRSTKGAGPDNFNEIRFEDKKGHEELHLQAERNMSTLVKADQSTTVRHSRTLSVVGKLKETFQADHEQTIKGPQTTTIETDRTESIKGTYDLTTDTKFNLTQGGTKLIFEGNKVTLDAASVITITRGEAKVTIDGGGNIEVTTPAGIALQCGANKIIIDPSGVEIKGASVNINPG